MENLPCNPQQQRVQLWILFSEGTISQLVPKHTNNRTADPLLTTQNPIQIRTHIHIKPGWPETINPSIHVDKQNRHNCNLPLLRNNTRQGNLPHTNTNLHDSNVGWIQAAPMNASDQDVFAHKASHREWFYKTAVKWAIKQMWAMSDVERDWWTMWRACETMLLN